MAIYLRNSRAFKAGEETAELFADLKAQIAAEDATVTTTDEGLITCEAGASCVTAAGELYLLNSSGVWGEVT